MYRLNVVNIHNLLTEKIRMMQTLHFKHESRQQNYRERQRCFPIHQLIMLFVLLLKNGYITPAHSMESGNDKDWGKLNSNMYRPPNGGASSLLNIPRQQNSNNDTDQIVPNSNLTYTADFSRQNDDNFLPKKKAFLSDSSLLIKNQETESTIIEKIFSPSKSSSVERSIFYVTKRNGTVQLFDPNKIFRRLEVLVSGSQFYNESIMVPLKHVQLSSLCETIVRGMYDGVTTDEIDVLAAESAASLCTQHFEYTTLAARILITRNHKTTSSTFSGAMKQLFGKSHNNNNQNIIEEGTTATDTTTTSWKSDSFLNSDLVNLIQRRGDEIDSRIRHERDFDMTYFGFKTLERAYLLRKIDRLPINHNFNAIIERPQYLLMRVALGIHCTGKIDGKPYDEDERLNAAFETYDYMSRGIFTHASPTLFHSGTTHPQLASCFLVQMSDDSINGIYDTLKQCAVISKSAGGIGLSVHNIRARGTPIRGTRGVSNGLVPMLRVFDVTSRYVDQGGGKRPGAFAIYIEPWHADVFDVLNLKKNHGKEEHRARDLFYGLWIPDLFMQRVQEDGIWSLMCPHQCPGLSNCYGKKFEALYRHYEEQNQFVRQVRARELWAAILESQIETGTPYMLYKDACNAKSNQQNLGTIQCSNLCTEIIQYTSRDEVAVCNLASICLPKFVVSDRGKFGSINPFSSRQKAFFDHDALHRATKIVTRNLNRVIDINQYPIQESRTSNELHRPIGIGVSGLADVFLRLGLPFTSPAAKQLNEAIFETIYHAALEASNELAQEHGPYATFQGSPASEGKLQFDLWDSSGVSPEILDETTPSHKYAKGIIQIDQSENISPPVAKQQYPTSVESNGFDWACLRAKIVKHGLRNSLLLAPMPTASTSQILGVNECFEPFSSNLYLRRVRAGEFIMANPHLLQDLTDNGLWNPSVRNQMMRDGGSVQKMPEIPNRLKELYKTVWEIKMKDIVDMAADRGRFIDQSQSLNLFLADPTADKLTAMHFYAWKKGLKTGMYYLRTKAAVNAIQYTVDSNVAAAAKTFLSNIPDAENDDICLSCQS